MDPCKSCGKTISPKEEDESLKKVYLTVDVECHNINKYNQYIEGRIGEEKYGIEKILSLAEKHRIPVNFFLDIPEAFRYGDEYIEHIINIIRKYNQPVYLHLHSDYITGDEQRTFFWQYTKEEQFDILTKGFCKYKELLGYDAKLFRIGRYGADSNMYENLNKVVKGSLIDTSYCYSSRNMCRYNPEESINRPFRNGHVVVFPNTRFCGFRILNKKYYFNNDITSANLSELKRVLSQTRLQNVICTMHVWDLMKSYFYTDKIRPNYSKINTFEEYVEFAKNNGWTFGKLEDFQLSGEYEDDPLDLTSGFLGFIRGCLNTFIRMQRVARKNKKYFAIYSIFYCCLAIIILLLFKSLIL